MMTESKSKLYLQEKLEFYEAHIRKNGGIEALVQVKKDWAEKVQAIMKPAELRSAK
jgi:hypothetical protein